VESYINVKSPKNWAIFLYLDAQKCCEREKKKKNHFVLLVYKILKYPQNFIINKDIYRIYFKI